VNEHVHKSQPCPACRKDGHDNKGNHLRVFPSGKFSCVIFPGDKAHNRRIIELLPELGSPEKSFEKVGSRPKPKRTKVAEYLYHDANGTPTYRVTRFEPKDFQQGGIKPDGTRTWDMNGVTLVPYNLPAVIAAKTLWIVEGEKDVESLRAIGIDATTNAGGALKWDGSWSHYFVGKEIILCPDNDDKGRRHMDQVEEALRPIAKSIRRVSPLVPEKGDISDYLEGLSDSEARAAIHELLILPEPLDTLLDARRFDISKPPSKPVPVLLIAGKPIATAGNLVAVTAQAKAGKTALLTGALAALMDPSGDCLGITGANPDGLAALHVDTEQSPYDHHAVILQVLRRAGRDKPPEWLRSYSLADVPTKDRRKALVHDMTRAAVGGKLRVAFIDGVADLCVDPNDPAEAFGLVEELHRLAITYACPIVCVLHENPGSETGKTRGHLGSQLERKAETNLRLSKDTSGVTVVFTERSRHCHIPRESGPRFVWDDVAGMHVSCGTARDDKAESDDFHHLAIVEEIFSDRVTIRYSELKREVMRVKGVKEAQAERTIKKLVPKYVRKGLLGVYEKL
jgi:5S rRNA maturation endonuclease (ribonuclease M5)